jgi:hypothetical protein
MSVSAFSTRRRTQGALRRWEQGQGTHPGLSGTLAGAPDHAAQASHIPWTVHQHAVSRKAVTPRSTAAAIAHAAPYGTRAREKVRSLAATAGRSTTRQRTSGPRARVPFLVVALHGLGCGEVHNKPHVAAVNTHPVRYGGHHDAHAVQLPQGLHHAPLEGRHARVVKVRGHAL